MALQGYLTKVKLGGTPTTMTSEAMSTYSTVADTYQVSSATKRVLSSTAALTFKSGSHTISSTEYTDINYLFGAITLTTAFTGSTVFTGSVKVSGEYIPTSVVAGSHAYQLTQSVELLDVTDYTSTGWKMRQAGLKDVSLSVSKFDTLDNSFYDAVTAGTKLLIEVNPGGGTKAARGWFFVETEDHNGDVGGIENSDITLQLSATPTIDNWYFGTI